MDELNKGLVALDEGEKLCETKCEDPQENASKETEILLEKCFGVNEKDAFQLSCSKNECSDDVEDRINCLMIALIELQNGIKVFTEIMSNFEKVPHVTKELFVLNIGSLLELMAKNIENKQ